MLAWDDYEKGVKLSRVERKIGVHVHEQNTEISFGS